MVVLRSLIEIEGMKRAGDLVARTFEMLCPRVVPGARLDEIDRAVEEFLLDHGAESPYKGYRPSPSVPPFPGTVCASINEEVVHGIPSRRKLRGGDVVGIDVGASLGGWIGDACYTDPVGEVSPAGREAARRGRGWHRRGGFARRLDRRRLLHVPGRGGLPGGQEAAGRYRVVPGGWRGGGEARWAARGRGGGDPGGGGVSWLRRGTGARGTRRRQEAARGTPRQALRKAGARAAAARGHGLHDRADDQRGGPGDTDAGE